MKKKIVVISVLGSVTVLSAGALLAFGLNHKNMPASGDPEVNSYKLRFQKENIVDNSFQYDDSLFVYKYTISKNITVGDNEYTIKTCDDYEWWGTYACAFDSGNEIVENYPAISSKEDALFDFRAQSHIYFSVSFDLINRANVDLNDSYIYYTIGTNEEGNKVYFELDDFRDAQEGYSPYTAYFDDWFNESMTIEFVQLSFNCVI